MVTKTVIVAMEVKVTVDETKFTPEFMEQFNSHMFDMGDDLDEHILNLAEKYVRGDAQGWEDDFLEGYGPLKDMGVRFNEVGLTTEIVEG